MPRRPTPPPGEGGRSDVPAQEAVAPPVEKKKIDAAFWDKFKEFQEMPAQERVAAILQHYSEYFSSKDFDPQFSGKSRIRWMISAWVLAHPGRDRFAAAQLRWTLERRLSLDHRPDSHAYVKEHWDDVVKARYEKAVPVLERAAQGEWPTDDELSDRDILDVLHQGAMQSIEGIFDLLGGQEVLKNKAEGIAWLESMDPQQLRNVVFTYHDIYEQESQQGDQDLGFNKSQDFLKLEIQKWKEGQGRGK